MVVGDVVGLIGKAPLMSRNLQKSALLRIFFRFEIR